MVHILKGSFFLLTRFAFPKMELDIFPLLENDCCAGDESSRLGSDRCQSFICPCSHEVEREPRQWFVSFRRGNICQSLISHRHRVGNHCWRSSQWGWGGIWVLLPLIHATQSNFHPSSILLHFACSNLSPRNWGKEGQVPGVTELLGLWMVWKMC